jgi:hypothetical protein
MTTICPTDKEKEAKIRPFSSAIEYMEWCSENCDRCSNRYKCVLECSIFRAMTTMDKTIGTALANDLGWFKTTSACPRIVSCIKKELNMRVFGKNEPYRKWYGPFDVYRKPKIIRMRVLEQVESGA